MIKGCRIQSYHSNLHATLLQVTQTLVPIARMGGSKNHRNGFPSKIKLFHRNYFFELCPKTSCDDCEYQKSTLYLTIPAAKKKKSPPLPIYNHTNREILAQ